MVLLTDRTLLTLGIAAVTAAATDLTADPAPPAAAVAYNVNEHNVRLRIKM